MESLRGEESLPKKKKGSLAMSYQDHDAIGSSVRDQRMIDNPTKSEGELMSDEEIVAFMRKQRSDIAFAKQPEHKDDPGLQSLLKIKEIDWKLNTEYLRDVGRLPEEFAEDTPVTATNLEPKSQAFTISSVSYATAEIVDGQRRDTNDPNEHVRRSKPQEQSVWTQLKRRFLRDSR